MVKALTRCGPETPVDGVLEALDRDGAAILDGLLDSGAVAALSGEIAPYIEATRPLDSDFAGRATTRTGALVARSEGVRQALVHERVLPVAERFLGPYCERIQLNLTQIIRLLPGQGQQELHRDRFIWGKYLHRDVEPQLNTLWALTPFTEENGATCVVPGSHRWDWDRSPAPEEVLRAEMPAGSALVYTGSVIHGGGRNDAAEPRVGMNLTYVLGWLRQEENQYLSCPPEIARELSPALQDLLGYTMGNYALGYYSPPERRKVGVDTLAPEAALGRSVDITEPEDLF